ncbi:hypothetical protein ACWT_5753 [Actinoplanes sp. SE50]|uniref:hypothetical protein n=1 Tax=unclassified Actinoplanes TaxID=2626549 RepID=UPI00023ED66E|nr:MULTISPECIES: hypothetical protein [unclassified Actinoplanes]AEV86771.1 hypothetical protein ACPL_5884 [Actinoplanes sp. SE50/110]ATO85168.1 hypothetical protein ACWT_5753 [Actinoplanes sp. SE50]SLM02578.1 hypothetical protein ACSP50_5860 [Actinoplanes sp. SE50/110]
MATWVNVYDSDDPWDEDPPILGSFDYDRVLRFDRLPTPVGSSRAGIGTTGDNAYEIINTEYLLRTACGRWVCEHFFQQPPGEPKINRWFYNDEMAATWLRSRNLQNVVEHYFGTPPPMPPGSQPSPDGDPIFFQPDAETSSRIDAYATASGFDRRYGMYWLLLQGLNAAEAAAGPENPHT